MILSNVPAKRCLTCIGWTVYQGKTLLVKHKKLGIWLAPGGHMDPDELPHQTAEREFLEESGVRVQVVSALATFAPRNTEALPMPFYCGLHWINKPRAQTGTFCEQHVGFAYFVRVMDDSGFKRQEDEVDDIGWFTQQEASTLLTPDLILEANYVFDHFPV